MDFSEKTRGARGVLGWNQGDLADRCGLSTTAINNIENGAEPRNRSRRRIIRSFENAGILFTDNGIEQNKGPVVILTDEDPQACYLLLLEDVARELARRKTGELLITNADDRVSPLPVNERYRAIRQAGYAMRQLVEAGNSYLLGPVEEYRCVPSDFFINRVTLIYGDNVAIVTGGETAITIIRDPVNAERERNTFNLLWSVLEAPTESTADERF